MLAISLWAFCALTSGAIPAATVSVAAATHSVQAVAVEPAKATAPVDAKAAFAKVKALAGKWAGKTEHGDAVIEFRLTGAGTAVAETMFPGTAHEMTNMYSMDGEDLYMVHYCGMGNQPRMKLIAVEGETLKFEAVSVANKSGPDASYMHSLELTASNGKLKETWGHLDKGKVETHATFELDRQ
jgi:hypothetical protein